MRKELKIKPLVYPQPVLMLATYNEDGSVDVMNAAWGCAVDYDMIGISLTPTHQTCVNFRRTGAFTVSMATAKTIVAADFFGIASGLNDKKKFEKSGLHAVKAEKVDAPIVEEFPVTLECLYDHVDEETGMVYGKIVRVTADESVLDENGHLDLVKAGAVCYDVDANRYYKIGEYIGDAFSLGKAIK